MNTRFCPTPSLDPYHPSISQEYCEGLDNPYKISVHKLVASCYIIDSIDIFYTTMDKALKDLLEVYPQLISAKHVHATWGIEINVNTDFEPYCSKSRSTVPFYGAIDQRCRLNLHGQREYEISNVSITTGFCLINNNWRDVLHTNLRRILSGLLEVFPKLMDSRCRSTGDMWTLHIFVRTDTEPIRGVDSRGRIYVKPLEYDKDGTIKTFFTRDGTNRTFCRSSVHHDTDGWFVQWEHREVK